MTAGSDYQQRAADFLKLWQDQMTRQMTDPDTIRAMLAAMHNFGAKPDDANPRHTADAPDAGDDAIRDFAQRLRAVERSLAALHARLDAAENAAGKNERAGDKRVGKGKRAVERGGKGAAEKSVRGKGGATGAKSKPVGRVQPVRKPKPKRAATRTKK